MRGNLRRSVVAWAVLLPGISSAQVPDPAPALPAPPFVPDRRAPVAPIVPLPREAARRLAPSATPTLSCGMRVVPVDPSMDPTFAKPVPDGPTRYTIRELPVPCQPVSVAPATPQTVPVPVRPRVPPAR